jgi:hypothetical protein
MIRCSFACKTRFLFASLAIFAAAVLGQEGQQNGLGRAAPIEHVKLVVVEKDTGRPVTLEGLWPDEWTVELCSGDEKLTTARVTLNGTETVECLFEVK